MNKLIIENQIAIMRGIAFLLRRFEVASFELDKCIEASEEALRAWSEDKDSLREATK